MSGTKNVAPISMFENEQSALLDSSSLLDETNSTVDFEATNEVLFELLFMLSNFLTEICCRASVITREV